MDQPFKVGLVTDGIVEQDYRMRRPRRPSVLRMLLELPLRLIFSTGVIVIRTIILVRRVLPASLLFLLLALIPVILFARSRLGDIGGWLMIGAALVLTFAAGALFQRR